MTAVNGDRVLIGDILPYDVPADLSLLHGPASGVLELPLSVYWGPKMRCDLETPAEMVKAYQAIVREGAAQEQSELLNAELLKVIWPSLILPLRCRQVWESRFPQLAA